MNSAKPSEQGYLGIVAGACEAGWPPASNVDDATAMAAAATIVFLSWHTFLASFGSRARIQGQVFRAMSAMLRALARLTALSIQGAGCEAFPARGSLQ
jgi:hypothetical protein